MFNADISILMIFISWLSNLSYTLLCFLGWKHCEPGQKWNYRNHLKSGCIIESNEHSDMCLCYKNVIQHELQAILKMFKHAFALRISKVLRLYVAYLIALM